MPDNDIQLMSEQSACALLDISRSTLRKLVRDGRIAPPVRLGSRLSRWRLSDLQRFVAENAGPAYTESDISAAKELAAKAVAARRAKAAAKAVGIAPGEPKKARRGAP